MKAVVTGGAGFIGSHIVDALIAQGYRVCVLDNLSTGRTENVNPAAELIVADVLDPVAMDRAFEGADVVFHQAARVSVRSSLDALAADAECNVLGSARVIEAVVRRRVPKLVFASTMAVYGEARSVPVSETHPVDSLSPYGTSKLAAERYCLQIARKYGFQAFCLRYFNTYGRRQAASPYVGVITHFINEIRHRRSPVIFGDGMQTRDFIHVTDVVRANLAALKYQGPSDVFNVGTGLGTSVQDLATLILSSLRSDVPILKTEPRPEEQRISIADPSKSRILLGFEATKVLASGITELL